MALVKKKKVAAPKVKVDKPKVLGLFDHLNAVYCNQSPTYFKNLSDGDKRAWSNYMIHRFISMNPNQIEIANYIQKYSKLPAEMCYRFYSAVLPKARQWNTYIKSKKSEKWDGQVIDYVVNYFECSKKEAREYLDILTLDQVKTICKKYGITDKELKKLL